MENSPVEGPKVGGCKHCDFTGSTLAKHHSHQGFILVPCSKCSKSKDKTTEVKKS